MEWFWLWSADRQGGSLTSLKSLGAVLAVMALSPALGQAEDLDRPRAYLGLRVGESNPLVRANDVAGVSLGVDLGRFLSAELSADFYELPLDVPGRGQAGEYGVMALAPQLRIRYPLLGGNLVPYVLGGVGAGVLQFNDRKRPGFGLSIEEEAVRAIGIVGAGVEYFLADNLALGLEGRYIASGRRGVRIEGARHPFDLDTGLMALTVRLLYPELRPPRPSARGTLLPARLYLGARIGGALPTHEEVFPEIQNRPEAPAWAGAMNQLFGIAAGVNLGRHLGIELPLEGYEMNLAIPGRGAVGEYALYTAIPLLRVRSSWMDGKLELYGLGGVGLTYAEYNDPKPAGAGLEVQARDVSLAGALGAGVEYFVTTNVAIGLEVKYVISRGHEVRIAGRPVGDGTLDSVLLSVGVRAFLGRIGGG
jgi:opacity protein-like surface antigen